MRVANVKVVFALDNLRLFFVILILDLIYFNYRLDNRIISYFYVFTKIGIFCAFNLKNFVQISTILAFFNEIVI